MVGVIHLGAKDEIVVPLQVITRAQAKDLPKPITKEDIEIAPTKNCKQKSWRERQAKMAAKNKKETEQKQNQKDE